MIHNTKCECGHQNPVGTVLCESCGKPQQDEDSAELLEMRYDGVARRSQKQQKNWIDQIWSFLSSVKVAVWLILITLIGASLGTIYPQQNVFVGNIDLAQYYETQYGTLGKIYYMLGLHDTYGSFWFQGLLVLIGASLVVCSLDRVLPLYRALKKQQIRKHLSFIKRQKVSHETRLDLTDGETAEEWTEKFEQVLRKRYYRVHRDGTALLAEKYRFSRWGPYINHIGLIIFLLAVLLRSMTAWEVDYVPIQEGKIAQIPGTKYYLENQEFRVEYYEQDELTPEFREQGRTIEKSFETDAVLYECVDNCDNPSMEPELNKLKEQTIFVNGPLTYQGLSVFEVHFEETPQLLHVQAQLRMKGPDEVIGTLDLDIANPQDVYTVGDYTLRVIGYYPEVSFKEGRFVTLSNDPNAPAFVFLIEGPELPEDGYVHVYMVRPVDQAQFQQDVLNETAGSPFELSVASMEDLVISDYTTYFNVKQERTMPFIWTGATISMIGLILGFYWHHRRIWLRIDNGVLTIGAHTNKNWFGIRQELTNALNKAGVEVDAKTIANEVNGS